MTFKVPEKYRITKGQGELNSTSADGNNGAFLLKSIRLKSPLSVIASDGLGWEHVSVSLTFRTPTWGEILSFRTPTWGEMCFVKGAFWGPEDCVVQFHPPESRYINNHRYVLHLWRSIESVIPMPNNLMV